MGTRGFQLLDPQVKTCPFQRKIHESILEPWILEHGKSPDSIASLPNIGVLAYDDEIFLAAGFLRRMERTDILMVDSFMVNPKLKGKRRYFALNAVLAELLEIAKGMRASGIIGWTVDSGTFKRTHRFGFKNLPHWGLFHSLK